MVQSIDAFNSAYLNYIQDPNNPHARKQSQQAADAMLAAVNNVTAFIDSNPRIVSPSQVSYRDVLEKRQQLSGQVDILHSMQGAPKLYNQQENVYDEYQNSYNSAIYVSILASIFAVFLIFIYFRSI